MIPAWFDSSKPTVVIAQNLLGHLLVHETDQGLCSGWIVETEAYVGVEDMACHGYQGRRTPRLEALFGSLGQFYVYQMRGHKLLNVVTEVEGIPTAVLIRAIEPYQGLDAIQRRRGKQSGFQLTNGPAKLTQALGIGMEYNGQSVLGPKLYLEFNQQLEFDHIGRGPRIGIPNKGIWTHKPLRFYVQGNPYLSQFG